MEKFYSPFESFSHQLRLYYSSSKCFKPVFANKIYFCFKYLKHFLLLCACCYSVKLSLTYIMCKNEQPCMLQIKVDPSFPIMQLIPDAIRPHYSVSVSTIKNMTENYIQNLTENSSIYSCEQFALFLRHIQHTRSQIKQNLQNAWTGPVSSAKSGFRGAVLERAPNNSM